MPFPHIQGNRSRIEAIMTAIDIDENSGVTTPSILTVSQVNKVTPHVNNSGSLTINSLHAYGKAISALTSPDRLSRKVLESFFVL